MLRVTTQSRNFVLMSQSDVTAELPDVLDVRQSAELLGISVRAVQHRIKTGALSARKLGTGRTSAYVITRAEVDRALAESAASA